MAGNYPDAPAYRLAYDRDGTQMYKISSLSVVTQLTAADMALLNDEDDDGVSLAGQNGGNTSLVFFFPQLMDLDGYRMMQNYSVYGAPGTVTIETSANSTNGLDGTWVAYSSYNMVSKESAKPGYRSISSATALAIRAVRFRAAPTTANEYAPTLVHLYGEPSPGENPNRLTLWHPTLDQRVGPAYFDWGNVPRGSSADRTFRVKNESPTLTANSVRVAMETATDTTPSVQGQHTLSADGTTFIAQVNLGALAPGAISSPVTTLRRVTPSNAVLSLWTFRLFAEALTWS